MCSHVLYFSVGGLKKLTKRNQIKKRSDAIITERCSILGFPKGYLVIIVRNDFPIWGLVIANVDWCLMWLILGKILHSHCSLVDCRRWRPEISGIVGVHVDLNFRFESESLIVSLRRLRILRTVVTSEDSNLEVKKKSPCWSERAIAAAGFMMGSANTPWCPSVRPSSWSCSRGDVSPLE